MLLTPQILEQLREKLLTEKVRVEEELNRIAKPKKADGEFLTKYSEIGSDEDENASEVEEYTANIALEANLELQLKEITEAIEKIQQGTYGFCENCGVAIPIDRLMAYPAAKKCLSC